MEEQAGPGAEESVSGELGERVRSIVAAAESMAAAIRSDAEEYAHARRRETDAEAERRLREAAEQADALLAERLARISDLSERILERADAVLARLDDAEQVRAQLEALTRALGETAERLARELGETPAPPAERPAVAAAPPARDDDEEEHPMAEQVRPLRPPGERAPRPLRQVTPAHVPHEQRDTRLDDARLVALQMAVAGRTREEVATHLREAFDVGDPDPILDHVFAEGFPRPSA